MKADMCKAAQADVNKSRKRVSGALGVGGAWGEGESPYRFVNKD